jgi:hypothetical protein
MLGLGRRIEMKISEVIQKNQNEIAGRVEP